jgi:two-component system chemotaxis response regulator CheY
MKIVLVIEDDHDMRVAIRSALEETNPAFTVLSATNGSDGLEAVRHVGPCVVILDMLMPLMSGEEFLRRKSMDPQIANIPVIAISAQSQPKDSRGIAEFLAKPFTFSTLVGAVRRHC